MSNMTIINKTNGWLAVFEEQRHAFLLIHNISTKILLNNLQRFFGTNRNEVRLKKFVFNGVPCTNR